MGFFDDLFNRSSEKAESIKLGRFSDAYKPTTHQKLWEESLLAFEAEKYTESIVFLMEFLKNPGHKNLEWSQDEEAVNFELFQGSKVLTGRMDKQQFRSEVKIAKTTALNIGLSRKLLERNYLLKYSRFGLDDEGHILLVFNSYTVDASPNKIYQGLKEMATQADKLDDLILDEFQDLTAINIDHILPRQEERKEREYQYLISELKKCFHEIEHGKLNIDQFPGGLSFLLLALNYKLDYLLTPEGFLMDNLEHNHKSYFGNMDREVGYRNNVFLRSFRKILERDKEDIKGEFYDVVSTFGLPAPSPHATLVQLIHNELPNMQWYKDNNHTAIALAIPYYIVGYCLFSYALPKPDMELLDLFYRILEEDYFKDSAYSSGGKLVARSIKKEVERIEDTYQKIFPSLRIDAASLDFKTTVGFAESYLLMMKNMNLNGADR